jgi:hypothetical protein
MHPFIVYLGSLLLCMLSMSAVAQSAALATALNAPQSATCPAEVPQGSRCYTGQDGMGAMYWIAIPATWNQVLVMHAHGGPADHGPAKLERSEEDLKRWAITTHLGYAWAGSTYRRGGYGVTMAAQDTERLRQIFVQHFGAPRRTLLHGQSYGGGVAAKAAELYSVVDGPKGSVRGPYDGVLLTSGVLGGGGAAYQFRLDLRVVYQQVCQNHPKPDEPSYPLWLGLPLDATLTRADLAVRVDQCTGLRQNAAQRTEQQKSNLATILSTVNISERALQGHLNWATWLFQDLVQRRLGGRNPFDNLATVYGAADAPLNQGVQRYAADPSAIVELARDSAPTGRVNVPVLTLHAINDPTANVALEAVYQQAFQSAGTAQWLVQTFSDESEHSYLSDPQYAALFGALMDWVDKSDKPTPQSIMQRCKSLESKYGKPCLFKPEFVVRGGRPG